MPSRSRREFLAACLASAAGGCGRAKPGSDRIVIATTWTVGQRTRLIRDFEAAHGQGDRPDLIWIRIDPTEDCTAVLRREIPDLFLGIAESQCRMMAGSGDLIPINENAPVWWIVRRAPLGIIVRRDLAKDHQLPTIERWSDLGDPRFRDLVALGDPRLDRVCLAWLEAVTSLDSWEKSYAELVRIAGNARPIGWGTGAIEREVESGMACSGPGVADGSSADPLSQFIPLMGHDWVEAAALTKRARNARGGRDFVELLARQGAEASREPRGPTASQPAMSDLLADLLGSTLVDAQPELKSAWRSVLAQGRPPQAEAFLTEPPPWPPASVVSLLSDRLSKPSSAAMIETLVEQLASNPAAQAWLNESWRKPVRHVDRSLLDDIGLVAQGRLESDPLFRRWLRAEWTAWARQRYRRVERVVKGRWSPTSVSLKAQSH